VAYAVGAAAAFRQSGEFSWQAFWLGYAVVFAIELATIFTNEYFDYEADRRNRNASPFSGGARVLVDGRLGFGAVRAGIATALCLVAVLSLLLARVAPQVPAATLIAYVAVGVFLGLGYTAPPFRFCYRGAGELVVGATHSFYVIVGGYLFQSGLWTVRLPWELGVPLFLSVLPAIILAGIPDRTSDAAVSKKTLAVLLGPQCAIVTAGVLVCVSAAAGLSLWLLGALGGAAGLLIFAVVPHGAALLRAVRALLRSGSYDRRIDPTMALSLSYIFWFGLVPLLSLLFGPKPS
jgi:1,4-dihydroxy-2-naphthoate octaprenyltransferase